MKELIENDEIEKIKYDISTDNLIIDRCMDDEGTTPLVYAIQQKKPEIVQLLLALGANIHISNAITLASNSQSKDIKNLIKKYPSLYKAQKTELKNAVFAGDTEIAVRLLGQLQRNAIEETIFELLENLRTAPLELRDKLRQTLIFFNTHSNTLYQDILQCLSVFHYYDDQNRIGLGYLTCLYLNHDFDSFSLLIDQGLVVLDTIQLSHEEAHFNPMQTALILYQGNPDQLACIEKLILLGHSTSFRINNWFCSYDTLSIKPNSKNILPIILGNFRSHVLLHRLASCPDKVVNCPDKVELFEILYAHFDNALALATSIDPYPTKLIRLIIDKSFDNLVDLAPVAVQFISSDDDAKKSIFMRFQEIIVQISPDKAITLISELIEKGSNYFKKGNLLAASFCIGATQIIYSRLSAPSIEHQKLMLKAYYANIIYTKNIKEAQNESIKDGYGFVTNLLAGLNNEDKIVIQAETTYTLIIKYFSRRYSFYQSPEKQKNPEPTSTHSP